MKNVILIILISLTSSKSQDLTVLFQYFDESVDIYVDEDEIVINANGVPSHLSPYFPETFNDSQNGLYFFEDNNGDGVNDWYTNPSNNMNVNPNLIGENDYNFRIPLNPVINPSGPTDTFLGSIGVSINGVPLYNEYEGPTAVLDPQTILSFDPAQGHPAPGGLYHYHFPPESLLVSTEDNFIGFAADGFPVYGTKNIDGTNVTDLDDYHAEFGPTPDFPDGIYHYHTNYTSPYIIGAFAGAIGTGFGGGGGGGGGGGVVDCDDVPEGMPCCGDGICGGPEDENNCPVDCGVLNTDGPSLLQFSVSKDTVNTYDTDDIIVFSIEAADSEDYLSEFIIRIILNGGPSNGGEIIEHQGSFEEEKFSSYVLVPITIPVSTTDGEWSLRVILEDVQGNIENYGPDELENLSFQNNLVVQNSFLSIEDSKLPSDFSFLSTYPNPFNPLINIQFYNSESGNVKIYIYNLNGKIINIPVNRNINKGTHTISWNAKNEPSGMYFVRMINGENSLVQKVLLMK